MEAFTRNMIVSSVCGAAFGLAWWIMIDILAYYPETSSYKQGVLYLPILLSTISLLINGCIPNSSLVENYTVTRLIFCHRLIFFLSLTFGFGGLLSAIIICSLKDPNPLPIYAAVGVPTLNGLILASNLVFKFALVDENDDIY